MSIKLLRLIKSVGIGGRIEIDSIRQALTVLGQKQLQHWVQLLLYATNGEAYAGPLMMQTAKRGKFMELLVQPRLDSTIDISGSRATWWAYCHSWMSCSESRCRTY